MMMMMIMMMSHEMSHMTSHDHNHDLASCYKQIIDLTHELDYKYDNDWYDVTFPLVI